MERFRSILRIVIAISTVMLLVFLAWNCLDIYLNSTDASTLDAVFTYDEVAHRLKGFALPFLIYALLILAALPLEISTRNISVHGKARQSHQSAACQAAASAGAKRSILRWGILILGALLLVWGIVNGGWYDVLVKSINICTECIGLG